MSTSSPTPTTQDSPTDRAVTHHAVVARHQRLGLFYGTCPCGWVSGPQFNPDTAAELARRHNLNTVGDGVRPCLAAREGDPDVRCTLDHGHAGEHRSVDQYDGAVLFAWPAGGSGGPDKAGIRTGAGTGSVTDAQWPAKGSRTDWSRMAANLARMAAEAGLTLDRLAHAANVPTGRLTVPSKLSMPDVARLADTLDSDPFDLLRRLLTEQGFTCPSWCTGEHHSGDADETTGTVLHRGPTFGPVAITGATDLGGVTLGGPLVAYIDSMDNTLDTDGLRAVAADALAAAEWLEAQAPNAA